MAGTRRSDLWLHPIRLFTETVKRAQLADVPKTPGVYRVRVLTENLQPVALRRLNGDDADGILHIGTSSDLNRRIGEFQGAAAGISSPSQSGWNFHSYGYVEKFPLNTLHVDYRTTNTERDAENLERQLHEQYRRRFLDRPSLDAQGGKSSSRSAEAP
jgi:excinuclease UvrABC nuclease subunit